MRASAETERLFTFTITATKVCVDDESLVLVRIGAAIAEGASQPRRMIDLACKDHQSNNQCVICFLSRCQDMKPCTALKPGLTSSSESVHTGAATSSHTTPCPESLSLYFILHSLERSHPAYRWVVLHTALTKEISSSIQVGCTSYCTH